jgi:hypothetical protein
MRQKSNWRNTAAKTRDAAGGCLGRRIILGCRDRQFSSGLNW